MLHEATVSIASGVHSRGESGECSCAIILRDGIYFAPVGNGGVDMVFTQVRARDLLNEQRRIQSVCLRV